MGENGPRTTRARPPLCLGLALCCFVLSVACRTGAPAGGRFVEPAPPKRGRTVRAPDGLAIAYDARGKGSTALVFVHCWAGDRSLWRLQLDAFKKDYRVVALDLGGHGASGRERKAWSILKLAYDVRAVVEAQRLERVILVGHSMGGPVALEAARLLPGRVVAVVCVDTLHNVEMQPPEELAEKMARRLEADYPGAMSEMVHSMFPRDADPAVVKWVTSRALAADPRVALALLRDFHNLDLKRSLSAAKVPVRCLNAAARGSEGVETAVEANQRYADFDVVLLERVGHFPMLERPDELNARLRALLAQLEAR
jgi:sigma-B regulation protein RsbQ